MPVLEYAPPSLVSTTHRASLTPNTTSMNSAVESTNNSSMDHSSIKLNTLGHGAHSSQPSNDALVARRHADENSLGLSKTVSFNSSKDYAEIQDTKGNEQPASLHPIKSSQEDDVSMEMQSEEDGTGTNTISGSTSALSLATTAEDGDEQHEAEHSIERVPLHVEVRLKPNAKLRVDIIRKFICEHLDMSYETLVTDSELDSWQEVDVLERNVDRVWVGECALPSSVVSLCDVRLRVHIYQPPLSSQISEFSTGSGEDPDGEDGGDDVPAASVLQLPSRNLEGLWDSLVYEDDVKGKLLGYIYSTILFSDASVDFNIVTWNRVVLLHGPPGTGKTSLCRALAQKLAIRLSDRYDHGKLIEINSHSLFSKWFSESGKLVQRLFASVTEMVDDESCFVVVLIDEVESLTAARAGAMSGKEPSDALRVVNALLTQLDKLKYRKNVLVMTTSNLSAAIDGAFIDRADIKQYIGLPPPQAIYWILRSCLNEMTRAGLVQPIALQDWVEVKERRQAGAVLTSSAEDRCSDALHDLAVLCHSMSMSGRLLRRLPVLAHARHIGMGGSKRPKMQVWLDAMTKCVREEGRQMDKVLEDTSV